MILVLYLSLIEVSFGMALIHCFIPRHALGTGFGKTISAIVFLCLLGPVIMAREFLPHTAPIPMALLQASGILALGFWFTYFVALNYPGEFRQRILVVCATGAQAVGILLTSAVLAARFYSPSGIDDFGPSFDWLFASLSPGLFASSLLLGSVTMALLIGHWYLVNPELPIDWLKGACLAFAGALAIKSVAIAISLTIGAAFHAFGPQGFFDQFRVGGFGLFVVRCFVGLVVPAGFCLMAYKAAAMRATQSSTGILFPAMIVVFIGEMIGASLIIGLAGLSV